MFEKRDRKIFFALLAFIVFLSWSNGVKMTEVQNRVNQLQSEISNIRLQVSNEVSEISSIVSDMREQERWWIPAKVQVEEMSKDEAIVKVEWQVREYQEDSKITFNYRGKNADEFTEIEAEEKSNGYFTVKLSIDPPQEPIIHLHGIRSKNVNSSRPVEVGEVEGYAPMFKEDEEAYEYYISMETQGALRNSDIINLDLWEITDSLFSPIDVNINIMDDGDITGFFHLVTQNETYYKVKGAFLETRDADNNVQERWYFEEDDLQEKNMIVYI